MDKNKKVKKKKVKGDVFTIFTKIFIVLTVIGIILWGGVYAINYSIGEEESTTTGDNTQTNDNITTAKKDVINALICGTNENLTDTIIYVRYDVKTGKLAFMSIPRDTYVTNDYCVGHKINAIYRGVNVDPLIKQVEGMLNVKIDYYLFVDTKIVRSVVDAMGGVEFNVPFRMKYDDYTQNLHINLYPGEQLLDGAKAEQFIRFRHNNDMTVGYASGDIGREKAQQDFIKAFITQLISPANIFKIPNVIKAAFNNTDTNVTIREALKYATDVPNLKLDDIYSCTAVGTTPYIDNLSYFVMDEKATQKIIQDNFINTQSTTTTTDTTTNTTTNQ